MSEEEVLSKEEIDALTSDDEDVDEVVLDEGKQVRSYDFLHPAHTKRGHFPTLEIINEQISKQLQDKLSELLQEKIEVIPGEIEFVKYSEFNATVSLPADLNKLHISYLDGPMLVCFGVELLDTFIEHYFGAPSFSEEYAIREGKQDLTYAEKKISMKLLRLVIESFTQGWSHIQKLDFQHVGSEGNPKMISVAEPSELVVRTTYSIEFDEHRVEFSTVIPYKLLDKIKNKLRTVFCSGSDGRNRIWMNKVLNRLNHVPVEITGRLGTTSLTVSKLLSLSDGDVIHLNKPEHVTLLSSGVPLFLGHLGESNSQAAVQVVAKINPTN